jgi:hypothetical protein
MIKRYTDRFQEQLKSVKTLYDVETEHVRHVLITMEGNKTASAEALGVSVRWLRIRVAADSALAEFRNPTPRCFDDSR